MNFFHFTLFHMILFVDEEKNAYRCQILLLIQICLQTKGYPLIISPHFLLIICNIIHFSQKTTNGVSSFCIISLDYVYRWYKNHLQVYKFINNQDMIPNIRVPPFTFATFSTNNMYYIHYIKKNRLNLFIFKLFHQIMFIDGIKNK